jgi:hypothetical protein
MTKNGTKDGDQRAAIELSCSGDMERGGQKNEVKVLSVRAFSPFVKLSLQRGSNSLSNRLWPHFNYYHHGLFLYYQRNRIVMSFSSLQ